MSGLPDEAVEAMYPCPTCWGTGQMESSDSGNESWWDCRVCGGTGRLKDRRRALPAGVYVSDGQGNVTNPDPSHSWSWGALRASASDCERAGLVAAAQTLRDVSEALFPVLAALSATATESQ